MSLEEHSKGSANFPKKNTNLEVKSKESETLKSLKGGIISLGREALKEAIREKRVIQQETMRSRNKKQNTG